MEIENSKTKIEDRIFTIREKQVMLDRDLAQLYQVETKQLNRAVKRNIERFPPDFMFQMTAEECSRCQFGTLNIKQGQNIKYMPYAFTEYGIAMLSGVLRSESDISANIRIMRAFAEMRKMLPQIGSINDRISLLEHHQITMREQMSETIDKVELLMSKLQSNTTTICNQGIFFDGQIYDAYAFVAGLVRKAARRIVLIDNYVDDTVLTLLNKRADTVTA